jgi:hypothetical protein
MIRRAVIRKPMMSRTTSSRTNIRTLQTFSFSLLILLLSSIALGQGGVATGDLHITVKDPSGNAVVNATVTVADVARARVATAPACCRLEVIRLPWRRQALARPKPGT